VGQRSTLRIHVDVVQFTVFLKNGQLQDMVCFYNTSAKKYYTVLQLGRYSQTSCTALLKTPAPASAQAWRAFLRPMTIISSACIAHDQIALHEGKSAAFPPLCMVASQQQLWMRP